MKPRLRLIPSFVPLPLWLAVSMALGLVVPAQATPVVSPPGLCRETALRAARDAGIPGDVLLAITLTETGRRLEGRFQPWPWTVNMEGKGHWFPDRAAAEAFVAARVAKGARSFDIGCFQINARWHGDAFASHEAMFDPMANARYAASFLRSLYSEFGDWSRAAGAYHSRTPDLSRRYSARFDRIRASLTGRAAEPPPVRVADAPAPRADVTRAAGGGTPDIQPQVRANTFPLLVDRGPALSAGSLVRIGDSAPGTPLLRLR